MLPSRPAAVLSARRARPSEASSVRRALAWAPLVGALLLFASCGRKIGDDCKTSLDCSQESDRLCDISQPGGYCTVEGCDEGTCPDEAVCIRFFPRLFITTECKDGVGCATDEICLDELKCAPRRSERRYCAQACTSNGDCRGGYECRLAGSPGSGSMALSKSATAKVRFCAPVAQ